VNATSGRLNNENNVQWFNLLPREQFSRCNKTTKPPAARMAQAAWTPALLTMPFMDVA
jgi:hypothetical protein